jgi:steroid 5-alpha reductase family enzyme
MREGLWRYSRHPNYFFQTLTWVAYALVATAAPWGWLAWICTAAMLLLILFVTGVKPAEESSLRSKGDDYRRYQRETSPFVPWPPRSSTG